MTTQLKLPLSAPSIHPQGMEYALVLEKWSSKKVITEFYITHLTTLITILLKVVALKKPVFAKNKSEP